MLRIAICDDETRFLHQAANFVQEYLHGHPELSGHIHTFRYGQELLYQVEETGGFDLYLLDIIMPGPNGIQTGLQLRELSNSGEIVYLTTSSDYAVDSYSGPSSICSSRWRRNGSLRCWTQPSKN